MDPVKDPTQREYFEQNAFTGTEVPRIAVKEVQKPVVLEIPSAAAAAAVIVTPAGFSIHNLSTVHAQFEQAQAHPFRRRGTYVAADIASLLAWMDKHTTDCSPVFAVNAETLGRNWQSPALALCGIGNYSLTNDKPGWHDFLTFYRFTITAAWAEWAKNNSTWMSQGEFSEFVERHLYEFSEPKSKETLSEAVTRMIEALGGSKAVATPGKMVEVSNGIKIMVSEQVEVELDRSTGEQSLKFAETHSGKGGRPVSIPKFFYIRIPVFFGEETSLIGVILRYRNIGGGVVKWSYELFAPDLVVKEAFDRACDVVRAKRTLYLGTPDQPNIVGGDILSRHL